jgi:hypothetical protein
MTVSPSVQVAHGVVKPAGERHIILAHPELLEALRSYYDLPDGAASTG